MRLLVNKLYEIYNNKRIGFLNIELWEYRTRNASLRNVEVCRILVSGTITVIRQTSKFLVGYSIFDIPTVQYPYLSFQSDFILALILSSDELLDGS